MLKRTNRLPDHGAWRLLQIFRFHRVVCVWDALKAPVFSPSWASTLTFFPAAYGVAESGVLVMGVEIEVDAGVAVVVFLAPA